MWLDLQTMSVCVQVSITADANAGTPVRLSETHHCHDAAGQIHGSFDERQS